MSVQRQVARAAGPVRRDRSRESPVETGVVAGLTHEGEGVVREAVAEGADIPQGKTAFVAGALPGETIRFRRVKRHRQHDEAMLVEVLNAAPERVTPRCAHFGMCGGCALQHLSPEAQLEVKQGELRDNLERIAHVVPERLLPPLTGPVWAYRRRARLGARFVPKKDRVVVGFRERLSSRIAETRCCEVLAAPVGELIEPLSTLLTGLSLRERVPQIEVAVADNATALVLRVLSAPSPADLRALNEFERAHGVRFYLQPAGLESVTRLNSDAHVGEQPLRYGLLQFDLHLEFAPTDFVQVNGPINEALVERAAAMLQLTPESRVLDLFCGLGNFTLALARRAARVVGVEGESALIERARHNARLNGVENVEFHMANLAEPLAPDTPWLRAAAAEGFTHILLDPPRAGAREVLPLIERLGPQRLLYISCHPGSLARDIGILVQTGDFALRAAGVMDMFPHTTHVESIAVLEPTRSTEGHRR